jgi:hypothetical protein
MKFSLLVRTRTDGYLYVGEDHHLYFCDHSGDGKFNIARPDNCADKASPIDLTSVVNAVTHDIYYTLKRADGYFTSVSEEIYQAILKFMKGV